MVAFVAFENLLPMVTFQNIAEDMLLSDTFPYEVLSDTNIRSKSECTSPFVFSVETNVYKLNRTNNIERMTS